MNEESKTINKTEYWLIRQNPEELDHIEQKDKIKMLLDSNTIFVGKLASGVREFKNDVKIGDIFITRDREDNWGYFYAGRIGSGVLFDEKSGLYSRSVAWWNNKNKIDVNSSDGYSLLFENARQTCSQITDENKIKKMRALV